MTRFLIVNTDYPAFLDSLYAAHPGLGDEPYARQLAVRNESLFGTSDYYPRNLNELGHAATEVHINNRRMQEAWAREHGLQVPSRGHRVVMRGGVMPWMVRDDAVWMLRVLEAQIEDFRPDVILTHSFTDLAPEDYRKIAKQARLFVGQIASPLADDVDLTPYDLLLSSLPNFVERFRRAGRRAELFRLAFDPGVLAKLGTPKNTVDVSFVGSLSPHHRDRVEWLEHVCRNVSVSVWGQGIEELPATSPIRAAFRGPAWGVEMFRVLAASQISLNHHIGIAGSFANNMRLYETTGVGSLLLTDSKQNLSEMFQPDVDVGVYRTAEECVEKIRYYLAHEQERTQIAGAGQKRTLAEHTYRQRMVQLIGLVEALL